MQTFRVPLVVCLLLLAEAAAFHGHESRAVAAASAAPAVSKRPTATARRALAGTLYLTQYASVRTAKGVYGFEPGCEVRLARPVPERQTMVVSDGQQEIEVGADLLTDDPALAAQARREDQALQAAIAAYWERQRADYAASRREIFIAHARDVEAAELAHNRGAAIGGNDGPLDLPAQQTGTAAAGPVAAAGVAGPDPDTLASAMADTGYDKLLSAMNYRK